MEELIKQLETKIDGFKNDQVGKSEFEALQNDFNTIKESLAGKAEVETLKTSLDEVAEKLTAIELKGTQKVEGFGTQLKNFLKDNVEAIKNIKATKSGVIEFVFKAPEDITTGNGVNTNPPNITGTQQAPLQGVNLRDFDVTNLTTNINTSLAAYPYTEVVPKDGDFAFLAEGEVKPQIDFTWETNYAKPVKVAAWERLTDESVQDVAGLESIAREVLFKKHNIKKSKGIINGDGVTPNPKGATTYGRLFVAGAMATSVQKPNFMDVVNAAITDIGTTHNYQDEMPYMASLVLINPVDFFINVVSAKTTDGVPLYPTASLFNQVVIGGVTIIPDEEIASGKILVCDMSKYNTTNYVPYRVQIGYVNDDFIKNQFVILGESRFHAFVKKLDEQAFIYDDIDTIKTAITAP